VELLGVRPPLRRQGEAVHGAAELLTRGMGERIRTMLPAPVRTNEDGELVAGDPAVVIVRIDADVIRIMEASIE
jgi:hypothetical protein